MNKEMTVKEGYHLIQTSFGTYLDGQEITKDEAETLAFIVNDIQLRDYLMGMSNDYHNDTVNVVKWLEKIAETLGDINKAYPFLTVLAMYYFETGDNGRATIALDEAQKAKPNYSLATLLRRVMVAGWPQGAVASMRNELHQKVRSLILDSDYSKELIVLG